jgi:hypothetical protein
MVNSHRTKQLNVENKKVAFSLPELHANRTIKQAFHVVDVDLKRDNMIIGQYLIQRLGLEIKGNNLLVKWDDDVIPWHDMDSTIKDAYFAEDIYSNKPVEQEIQQKTDILDAKYKKANLKKVVDAAMHLSNKECNDLYNLLKKHEDLFDGMLGTFTRKPYNIKLKDNMELFHTRPFPVPRIYKFTFKSELDQLCSLGVLKKVNGSQWGAPTCIIPKQERRNCTFHLRF